MRGWTPPPGCSQKSWGRRIRRSRRVCWTSRHCIVLVPGLKKGAFVVGGKFGRGYAICRAMSGQGWGPPAAIRIEGGSFGFQIGVSSTDVILLIMNEGGMKHLTSSKFTIGARGHGGGRAGGTRRQRPDRRSNDGRDSFLVPIQRHFRRGFAQWRHTPQRHRRKSSDVRPAMERQADPEQRSEDASGRIQVDRRVEQVLQPPGGVVCEWGSMRGGVVFETVLRGSPCVAK